jgi:hypothetical protein
VETLEAESKASNEKITGAEKCSDKGDFEEYLKLRQLEIQSKDFANACLKGLEEHHGTVPKISKKKQKII